MRSTNELRRGNFLLNTYHNNILTVTAITTEITINGISDDGRKYESMSYCDIGKVVPIPLTGDWLQRFGFERATDAIGGWWSPSFGSNIVGLRWEFGEHIDVFRDIYWSYCVSGTYHVKAKYVHQLQNAIFVLLGKELELKS